MEEEAIPDLGSKTAMVETITHANEVFAIIVRSPFDREGIHFFTPGDYSQQLAFIKHPKGKFIEPHLHNPVPRQVAYTQEVLFVRKGRVLVNFYAEDQSFLESRTLGVGDVILLIKGGHGFEVLEDLEMFEVKQGPYAGDHDKTRFPHHGLKQGH